MTPMTRADAQRLREIAEELEEMARGYLEKGAQLHHEAARSRAAAHLLERDSDGYETGN